MDPADWSANDVSEWLIEKGFQKYSQLLCVEHQIDGQGLLSLTEHDLKQPPIEIRVIGDVKRLMHSIKNIEDQNSFSVLWQKYFNIFKQWCSFITYRNSHSNRRREDYNQGYSTV